MESEENYVAFVLCILCIVILRRRLRTRYRYVWSRDWLLRRQQHSAYYTLIQEMDREDASEYANYLLINKETFDMHLKKKSSHVLLFTMLLIWMSHEFSWFRLAIWWKFDKWLLKKKKDEFLSSSFSCTIWKIIICCQIHGQIKCHKLVQESDRVSGPLELKFCNQTLQAIFEPVKF